MLVIKNIPRIAIKFIEMNTPSTSISLIKLWLQVSTNIKILYVQLSIYLYIQKQHLYSHEVFIERPLLFTVCLELKTFRWYFYDYYCYNGVRIEMCGKNVLNILWTFYKYGCKRVVGKEVQKKKKKIFWKDNISTTTS